MTTLPITGNVDPGFLAGLAALRQGYDGIGDASERAGQKAAASSPAWSSNIDTIRRGAQAFNEAHMALRTITSTIGAVITRVGGLADEQARLNETSRRLGLDFDAAASAAGRFVDETEAMGVANRFASHTVEERLAALHVRAGQVTVAVDDSAAAMARFADRIEDSERTVATALVEEIARLDQVASSTSDAASSATDWDNNLKAAGQTIAYVGRLALSGLQIIGGAVGAAIGGITGTISIAGAGLEALISTRSLSGARAAMTRELAAVRRDGLAVQSADMLSAGITAAGNLALDQATERTTAAPDAPPAARPRTRTPRTSGGGTQRAANDNADMTFTAEQAAAEDAAARTADLEAIAGLSANRAEERRRAEIDGLIAVEAARQDAATQAQDTADKERRRLDSLREAHESYAGRLAELPPSSPAARSSRWAAPSARTSKRSSRAASRSASRSKGCCPTR